MALYEEKECSPMEAAVTELRYWKIQCKMHSQLCVLSCSFVFVTKLKKSLLP